MKKIAILVYGLANRLLTDNSFYCYWILIWKSVMAIALWLNEPREWIVQVQVEGHKENQLLGNNVSGLQFLGTFFSVPFPRILKETFQILKIKIIFSSGLRF